MIIVIGWVLAIWGFAILCVSVPRHRRAFGFAMVSNQRERLLRVIGFVLLAGSFVSLCLASDVSTALLIWCGVLSLSALLVTVTLAWKKASDSV